MLILGDGGHNEEFGDSTLEWIQNRVGILKGNGGSWGLLLGGDRVMKRFKGGGIYWR